MDIEMFLQTLPIMLKGMGGIFGVTIVIMAAMTLLNKVGIYLEDEAKKKKTSEEK